MASLSGKRQGFVRRCFCTGFGGLLPPRDLVLALRTRPGWTGWEAITTRSPTQRGQMRSDGMVVQE